MNLKPWREVAEPHEDVRRGTFVQAEFAADISRVHAGTATAEYQDPSMFFERTFITEGMALLLDSVVKRLSGMGGDPVIQLQTAFGGGKTHTMLAVYHLARAQVPSSAMTGVSEILTKAGVHELPQARIAVIDGIKASPSQAVQRGSVQIHTLWGDLAWQLGGEDAYALVASADQTGTSPGKEALTQLLSNCAPCVILVDELVAYIRQFEEGKSLSGGSFDSNLSFIQALTEALKSVPTAVMLASLPESEKEAGSQRGVRALEALSHYFGRIQALWKPVGTEEAFAIVRRRLFSRITDDQAAYAVCRKFADYYTANGNDFPQETQESRYFDRLLQAYPIHPEVFDRLYEDWSSLDNFQRTRGVLKLMAKVIHRLWTDNDRDLMIMPGSFPLADADTRNELVYYLPQGWDPVVERDIDGERAETTEIESRDTRLGSVQACRRSARTIFLGSAPSTSSQIVRGLDSKRIALGTAQPGQQVSLYNDALRRLTDHLHYLNVGNDRFWFDTRPNLRREMEDRKRRYQDREDVLPLLRDRIQRSLASSLFGGTHVFTPSSDIPDDFQLRLVILPPDAAHSKHGRSAARDLAADTVKKRGDQPRFKQNRLLFVAADADNVSRLKDQVRAYLAWNSIVSDYQDNRIVLDNLMAKQAKASQQQAEDTLRRTIREAYKWLLAPVQEIRPDKGLSEVQWDTFPLNTGSANWSQEIESVLHQNELLITKWAPVHLAKLLKDWFWQQEAPAANALDVWQQTCQQLYLPRLKDDHVFMDTLALGTESRDFFALAQGKEQERYLGFVFGQRTTPILDNSLLLIAPAEAQRYVEWVAANAPPTASQPQTPVAPGGFDDITPQPGTGNENPPLPYGSTGTGNIPAKTRFHASVDLKALTATMDFAQVVEEVIQQFSIRPDAKIQIRVDIEVDSATPFDDATQRIVKENCHVLGFNHADFEGED